MSFSYQDPVWAPTADDRQGTPALSPSTKRMIKVALILLGLVVLLFATASFWVNWWWYDSIGYQSVIRKRYTGQLFSFLLGALIPLLFIGGNIVRALRRTRTANPGGRATRIAEGALRGILGFGLLIVAIVFGLNAASHWESWQLFRFGGNFGITDPVFEKDAAFYIFKLPVFDRLVDYAFWMILLAAVAATLVYAVRWGVQFQDVRSLPEQMRGHLFTLGGMLMLVLACWFYLRNFHLAYSERGAVFGASYTDVTVVQWANWSLMVGAVIVAVLLILNGFFPHVRLLLGAAAVWVGAALLLGWLVPSAVQRTVVEPNELNRESEYIQNNIDMTRLSFDLDGLTATDITGADPLTAEALSQAGSTLRNVRLWDYRVAGTTYQQLQSFVPYYVFNDLDVARYLLDGEIEQVLIAARELDQAGLPATAHTWTNQHLVYTHGYGVVVNQVRAVSDQGLPEFVVGNIPPNGQGKYSITQPEIYFGELTDTWVALDTKQAEFSGLSDVASDDSGIAYQYSGTADGSIALDSYLRKLMLAIDIGDRNLLFSGALTDDSKVLLRREITDRVNQVAPFVELDGDPYVVIVDGKLFWIIDAYTTSDRFPHASRAYGINYIRNSVKITVDAYNGTVTLYRTGVADPIADAYDEIYGNILRPISEAPAGISDHFRYPETLFEVQSDVLSVYHVTDPGVFYNGEDRWAIPTERIATGDARMESFYVTMAYPGDSETDFTLIRPFIPGGRSQRQNMTAWLGGRADTAGVSELALYRFPRQTTVFGPTQVAARIDQEPEISAQITLWNQSGSEVIRGNLLVIPIENSVLYVQPLYLQASSSQGALPELKRVIVASQERVVMRTTLDEALLAITAETDAPVAVEEPDAVTSPGDGTLEELAAQAIAAFEKGQEALKNGDWTGYAAAQVELETALLQMQALKNQAPPAATPTP